MAITIIGEKKSGTEVHDKSKEIDLPHPRSAPEGELTLTQEKILALLGHENPLLRRFAVEQAGQRREEDWTDALIARVHDENPIVATEAIRCLAEHRAAKGAAPKTFDASTADASAVDASTVDAKTVDAIAGRFRTASGELAATAARALGRLAPMRLLDLVRQRGRLDDEAYATTASALAVIGSPEVIDFLDQALNRSLALQPERRVSLYGAALLSGHPRLAGRVIALAVRDSKEDPPEKGVSFPSRAALAAISALPIAASRSEVGLKLYDGLREAMESVARAALPSDDHRAALDEAIRQKRPAAVLECLAPILQIPLPSETAPSGHAEIKSGLADSTRSTDRAETKDDAGTADILDSLGSLPRRRHGLLSALIEQRGAIGALDLKQASIFLVVAIQAVEAIVAGGRSKVQAPAVVALSKALEGAVSPAALEAMSLDSLTSFFSERSPRDMRRLLSIMAREDWTRESLRVRFAEAALRSGHADGLLQAASEVDDDALRQAIARAAARARIQTESAIVEALEERPLDDRKALFAVALSAHVRTTRVALALGRNFRRLGEAGRALVPRTMLRVAHPCFLPLLEARAFRDEPEEVMFFVLSLAHGCEVTGRLKDILDRFVGGNETDPVPHLRLALRCKRCQETFSYRIEQIHLDPASKNGLSDTLFEGDTTCKACGTPDELEPTPEAEKAIAMEALETVKAAQEGRPVVGLILQATEVDALGQRMGVARALRRLNEAIAASPDSIRARLQRASILTRLDRPGAVQDAEAILRIDPSSVEAKMLLVVQRGRNKDYSGAMQLLEEIWRQAQPPNSPRLYDWSDPNTFIAEVENHMVVLGQVTPLPPDIDLTRATARLREMEADDDVAPPGTSSRSSDDSDVDDAPLAFAPARSPSSARSGGDGLGERLRRAGRNDPCPCGSGKKFKKCHGR